MATESEEQIGFLDWIARQAWIPLSIRTTALLHSKHRSPHALYLVDDPNIILMWITRRRLVPLAVRVSVLRWLAKSSRSPIFLQTLRTVSQRDGNAAYAKVIELAQRQDTKKE